MSYFPLRISSLSVTNLLYFDNYFFKTLDAIFITDIELTLGFFKCIFVNENG